MSSESTNPLRILICDDQEVVRKGLTIILSHQDGLQVVGFASNGHEAVALTEEIKPDVILMDLKMPRLNGIQATKQIVSSQPAAKIVVLTTFDGDEWVFDALRAGAVAYLLKDSSGEEIVQAVYDAAAGRSRLDPQIASKLLDQFRQSTPPPSNPLVNPLTARELSILQLMAKGHTNGQIAKELFLASGTVKNNVSQILSKFQVADRTQAVLAALRRGIVTLE